MSDRQTSWELEGGYAAAVFGAQSVVTEQDVLELWTRESELDRDEATRRLSELLLVVIDPDRRLVAISTAYPARSERLRAELWHIRMFVAAAHRQRFLAAGMSRSVAEYLTQRHVSGIDPRGIGMVYEIESEILKRNLNQAVSPAGKFTFIGLDSAGRDIRVRYFPGALAPEPA
jgi:hypothetical protein